MTKHRYQRGFSLVEILVVTSVITVGFMAVLGLVRKAIIVYYNNQNYLIAATVAQQGLELTRYIRDDNWLADKSFNLNIAKDSRDGTKTIFAIDSQAMADPQSREREKIIQFYNSVDSNNKLSGLPEGADLGNLPAYVKNPQAKIYLDTKDGHNSYVASSALPASFLDDSRYQPTIFHNLVETVYHNNNTENSEDDYLSVTSLVYWQDRGADKYFSLTTYLYDYSWKY